MYITKTRRPDQPWGPYSPLYNGYWKVFPPGVKPPAHEADHILPFSAPYTKHRDKYNRN
jgi:hypothetical protein